MVVNGFLSFLVHMEYQLKQKKSLNYRNVNCVSGAKGRRSSVSNFEVCPAYVSKVSNPGGAGNLGHRTHGHSVLWIKQQSVHLSGELSWLREGFKKK